MNMAIRSIIVCLAIFMLVPQSFAAITAGFGGYGSGGSVSSWNIISMGPNAAFRSNQILSLQPSSTSLSSNYQAIPFKGDWANQYHQADSGDGKRHVATYAYMNKPSSYSYSYNPSTTSSSASISEDLTATDARNLTYGGFAYNSKDYAAVQIKGEADSIKYHNDLYSGSNKVSAHQNFNGTGCNFSIYSWAERGNIINESKDHTAFDVLNTSGGFSKLTIGAKIVDATFAMFAGHGDTFKNANINSCDSQAALTSDIANTVQSANISSADYTFFGGHAMKGLVIKRAGNKSSSDSYIAKGSMEIFNGTGIKYSGTSTSSSTNQSIAQKLNIASDEIISIQYGAGYRKNSTNPDKQTKVSRDYGASQDVSLTNATVGAKGLQGATYINGATAVAIQSAIISSADSALFNRDIQGVSENGNGSTVGNISNGENLGAGAGAYMENGKIITYLAKSTATNAAKISACSASATQSLSAKSSDYMHAVAASGYDKEINVDKINGTGAHIGYDMHQDAKLNDTTFGKNAYQSSVSISGGIATGTQSADILAVDRALFTGWTNSGKNSTDNTIIGNINSKESMGAHSQAHVENGKAIVYFAKSAVTSAQQISAGSTSATQSLNAKSSGHIDIDTASGYDSATIFISVNGTGPQSHYDAFQGAWFSNATLGKNGYKGTASIGSGTATGNQSADVLTVDEASFNGNAGTGRDSPVGNKRSHEGLGARDNVYIENSTTITYSAKSTFTNSKQIIASGASATQSLNAKSSELISAGFGAGYDSAINWDSVNLTGTQSHYNANHGARLENVILGKNGYQGTASINGAAVTNTQLADISAADHASFSGSDDIDKQKNDTNTRNNEHLHAEANTDIEKGKTITYSATYTTDNIKQSSLVAQNIIVKSAKWISREAIASWSKHHEDSAGINESSYFVGCNATAGIPGGSMVTKNALTATPLVLVSMTGTNTDTAVVTGGKTGQASATQSSNVNTKGGVIHRELLADQSIATNGNWRSLFHADTNMDITADKICSCASNSLVGQSTAIINVNTSATLAGSWSGKVARELGRPSVQNFRRNISAINYEGDYSNIHIGKYSKSNVLLINIKESANVVKDDATVT